MENVETILVRCGKSGNDIELKFSDEICKKIGCSEYKGDGICNIMSYCGYVGASTKDVSEDFIQDGEY